MYKMKIKYSIPQKYNNSFLTIYTQERKMSKLKVNADIDFSMYGGIAC